MFGKLTVLREYRDNKGRYKCECKCSCGNTCVIRRDALLSGSTRSCGCLRKQNVVGKRFGRLVVTDVRYDISYQGKPAGRAIAFADCDCGEKVVTPLSYITSGNKKSCGCYKKKASSDRARKDLTGNKYGRLRVVEMIWGNYKERKKTQVRCRCDCGNEIIVFADNLTSGHTKSCGCFQQERRHEIRLKDYSGMVSPSGITLVERTCKRSPNGNILWKCRCGMCGSEFLAEPYMILNGHISSCGCRKISSREYLIRSYLTELNIPFKTEYIISDCNLVMPLRFDFAIFSGEDGELLKLIEYDGEQHFYPVEPFGGEPGFRNTLQRDNIKDNYCLAHGIQLKRLSYCLSDAEIKEQILDILSP